MNISDLTFRQSPSSLLTLPQCPFTVSQGSTSITRVDTSLIITFTSYLFDMTLPQTGSQQMELAQSHSPSHTIKTSGAHQISQSCQGLPWDTCGHVNSIGGELCNTTGRLWISLFEVTQRDYSVKQFHFDVTWRKFVCSHISGRCYITEITCDADLS